MAMLTKTMDEILKMAGDFHQGLATSLDESAYQISDERSGLLLNYLANQESKLSQVLKGLRLDIGSKELNTWFYEYSDRHSVLHSDPRAIKFEGMSVDEIQEKITTIHNELIDVFQHMYERAENNTIKESLDGIVILYQSTVNRISFNAEVVNEL